MKTTIGKNHAGFGAGCLVAALAAALPLAATATQIERDANAGVILQDGRTVLIYETNGTFTVTEPGTVELLAVGGGAGGAAGGSGVFIVRYAIKPLATILYVR